MNEKYEVKDEGVLWKKVAKSGLHYYSGKLTLEGKEYFISMFNNDKKGNDKAPDFRIIFNEPMEQVQETVVSKTNTEDAGW